MSLVMNPSDYIRLKISMLMCCFLFYRSFNFRPRFTASVFLFKALLCVSYLIRSAEINITGARRGVKCARLDIVGAWLGLALPQYPSHNGGRILRTNLLHMLRSLSWQERSRETRAAHRSGSFLPSNESSSAATRFRLSSAYLPTHCSSLR